jgi:hypothetical protein
MATASLVQAKRLKNQAASQAGPSTSTSFRNGASRQVGPPGVSPSKDNVARPAPTSMPPPRPIPPAVATVGLEQVTTWPTLTICSEPQPSRPVPLLDLVHLRFRPISSYLHNHGRTDRKPVSRPTNTGLLRLAKSLSFLVNTLFTQFTKLVSSVQQPGTSRIDAPSMRKSSPKLPTSPPSPHSPKRATYPSPPPLSAHTKLPFTTPPFPSPAVLHRTPSRTHPSAPCASPVRRTKRQRKKLLGD